MSYSKHNCPRLQSVLGLNFDGPARRLVPRSKRAKEACARFAERWDVDESIVLDWANGRQQIPDELIEPIAESFGYSVRHFMCWEDAPRSVIPDHWRREIARDVIDRTNGIIPGECDRLLEKIESRLTAEAEFEDPAPCVPRLQRLRRALLEIQGEPLDVEWAEAKAEQDKQRQAAWQQENDQYRRWLEELQEWERVWKALPIAERERQVLANLGDGRLTIKQVAASFGEEAGISRGSNFMNDVVSQTMRRMFKAGRLERAVVKRNVHCYFRPRALDGPIAELERAYNEMGEAA